jgi:hypothetical protein
MSDNPEEKFQVKLPNKAKMRNLVQFKGMSDDEFEEYWTKLAVGAVPVQEFEARIETKMKELENDYDFSEMKINDKVLLRNLCQALIQLEDYEQISYRLRTEGVNAGNIMMLRNVGELMSNLRNDISRVQDDLKITRKIRKSDKEASVINTIETLKEKARKFYDQKMMYIFCPKCNMLLGTIWTLYPSEERNKITLVCNRRLDNDTKCGEKVVVLTKDMLALKGTNNPEVLPDTFK